MSAYKTFVSTIFALIFLLPTAGWAAQYSCDISKCTPIDFGDLKWSERYCGKDVILGPIVIEFEDGLRYWSEGSTSNGSVPQPTISYYDMRPNQQMIYGFREFFMDIDGDDKFLFVTEVKYSEMGNLIKGWISARGDAPKGQILFTTSNRSVSGAILDLKCHVR